MTFLLILVLPNWLSPQICRPRHFVASTLNNSTTIFIEIWSYLVELRIFHFLEIKLLRKYMVFQIMSYYLENNGTEQTFFKNWSKKSLVWYLYRVNMDGHSQESTQNVCRESLIISIYFVFNVFSILSMKFNLKYQNSLKLTTRICFQQ